MANQKQPAVTVPAIRAVWLLSDRGIGTFSFGFLSGALESRNGWQLREDGDSVVIARADKPGSVRLPRSFVAIEVE